MSTDSGVFDNMFNDNEKVSFEDKQTKLAVKTNDSVYLKQELALFKKKLDSFANTNRSQLLELRTQILKETSKQRESLEKIRTTLEEILESHEYLRRLKDSEWPLYLVGNRKMMRDIVELKNSGKVELTKGISDIAYRYLDNNWISEVRERWIMPEDFEDGDKCVLNTALNHHISGEYYACVALLMCMSEGLIDKYCGDAKKIEGENLKIFNRAAKKYGLDTLTEKGTRGNRGFNVKDKMLIIVLQVKTSSIIIDSLCSYIIEILFTNKDIDGRNDYHPRRNKICHGTQTNYNTLEHSLKSILAIDAIIRLGRLIKSCD